MSIDKNKENYLKTREELIQAVLKYVETGLMPPWVKPWRSLGPHRNPVTGTIYKGVNVFTLSLKPFIDTRWLTCNNIRSLKGTIKKGEKAAYVIYAGPYKKTVKNESTGEEEEKFFKGRPKAVPVFNVEQCEDLEGLEPLEPCHDMIIHEEVESIISSMPVNYQETGSRAYYRRSEDLISMPPREIFKDMDNFYSTFLHEAGHSTGHHDRLNRKQHKEFGDKAYAYEELIAEFTSAYLSSKYQINGSLGHPEYLAGWLEKFGDETEHITNAALDAVNAAEFIVSNYIEQEFTELSEAS